MNRSSVSAQAQKPDGHVEKPADLREDRYNNAGRTNIFRRFAFNSQPLIVPLRSYTMIYDYSE